MQRLEPDAFAARLDAFDAAVLATEGIDHFCTSSAWVVPAREAFHPETTPVVFEGAEGFVALARDDSATVGRYLAPLEAMWGLASPVAGARPVPLAREVVGALSAIDDSWDTLWLCGLSRDSRLFKALVAGFGKRFRLGLGPETRRYTASLEGGLDGFMSRRSAKFRANLRRAARQVEADGFAFEAAHDVRSAAGRETFFERLMAIEARSWKGLADSGVNEGPMRQFYRQMLDRIGPAGQVRALVLTRDGEDVAYILGGLFAGAYRGLQVSFDDRFRALSLGNVMQLEMIRRLCDEGVGWYDLGSDIPYKARWAEDGLTTVTLVVLGAPP